MSKTYLGVLEVVKVHVTDILGGGQEDVTVEGFTIVLWIVEEALLLLVGEEVVLGVDKLGTQKHKVHPYKE